MGIFSGTRQQFPNWEKIGRQEAQSSEAVLSVKLRRERALKISSGHSGPDMHALVSLKSLNSAILQKQLHF
jgi:hypothetical protein